MTKTAREAIEQIADDLPTDVIAALDAAGFVIVPKEPTEEMIAAAEQARKAHDINVNDPFWIYSWLKDRAPIIYRAMIAASQEPKP